MPSATKTVPAMFSRTFVNELNSPPRNFLRRAPEMIPLKLHAWPAARQPAPGLSIAGLARKQRFAGDRLRPVHVTERVLLSLVHGDARVLAPGVQNVKTYAEIGIPALVQQALFDRIRLYPLQRFEPRVFRRHPPAEVLDDQKRAEIVEVRLSAPRRARGPDGAVDVKPRAQDGRIAHAAGYLPRESARRRHSADLPCRVDGVTVDRSVKVRAVDQAFVGHLQGFAVPRLRALRRIEIARRVGAPLPFEPELARILRVQIVLYLEAHTAGESLRVPADYQVVIGQLHHRLRDERGRTHAFERSHRARALFRPVHNGRVELNYAFGIRQAAVADAIIERVELDYVHARKQGIEHVHAARHHRECRLDAREVAAVLEAVAIGRRDDHRLRV